jgi:hypothetical protein
MGIWRFGRMLHLQPPVIIQGSHCHIKFGVFEISSMGLWIEWDLRLLRFILMHKDRNKLFKEFIMVLHFEYVSINFLFLQYVSNNLKTITMVQWCLEFRVFILIDNVEWWWYTTLLFFYILILNKWNKNGWQYKI